MGQPAFRLRTSRSSGCVGEGEGWLACARPRAVIPRKTSGKHHSTFFRCVILISVMPHQLSFNGSSFVELCAVNTNETSKPAPSAFCACVWLIVHMIYSAAYSLYSTRAVCIITCCVCPKISVLGRHSHLSYYRGYAITSGSHHL